MTDAELRDAAVSQLKLTSVGYINKNWTTPPKGTHWANAIALLAQIGETPPPPAFSVKGMYDASGGGKAANWPTISSYGFNLTICSADDSASLAAVKKTGGKAWVSPGVWTGSGFSTTDSQAVAMAQAAVATGVVAGLYVADEPSYSAANIQAVAARAALLKSACPGVETLIAYYDAGTLAHWKGAVDAFALDVYPSRSNWNMSLITQLAAAADAAGLRYYGVVGAFTAPNYPLPTAAQLQQMIDLWGATKQVGYAVYAWGPTGGTTAQQLQNQPTLLSVLKSANG